MSRLPTLAQTFSICIGSDGNFSLSLVVWYLICLQTIIAGDKRSLQTILDLEGKTIFIEEYSMVPNKWMTKIYQAFIKYPIRYIHSAIPISVTQLKRAHKSSTIMLNLKSKKYICPERVKLEYIEGCSRHDTTSNS